MPLYVSVPLPGPFRWHPGRHHHRYVHTRHSRFSAPWYWLFGVFTLEMAFWVLVAEALAVWYAGKGAVWLYHWWRGRRHGARAAAPPPPWVAWDAPPVNPRMYHSSRR